VQLARLMLLGGVSSSEPILMWWKFVGCTHEEIAGFREEWEFGSKRFGRVEGLPRPGTKRKTG
jgi:quercetin 2,3-dioxygenase